jgi:serine/threonine protein kinase
VTQTVISHYRILHQLGEGGMGVVFCAEDLRLGREVAIKFLRADEPDQEQWLARFEREARLASALKHPHICTIHELGEHAGRPFIVMELLEGRTIKQLLANGPLPLTDVVEFSIQIADALAAAHQRVIVHRDIKPANLFVTRGNHLKILDFGLAKIAAPQQLPQTGPLEGTGRIRPGAGPEVTSTGATVGTAAYMSPEQATGARIDARTDLFSFGSVIYEMATGKRAFPGENAPAVLQRLIAGEYVPPRALNPAIPEALDAIIRRALQTDKAARYQNAGEMLQDLRAIARQLSDTVQPAAADVNIPSATPARQPRHWWIGAAAGAAIVLALAGWRFFSSASASPALSDRDSILIADFANNTGEGVFDQTLVTALKTHLNQSPFLDIVPDDRIAETLGHMSKPRDTALTGEVARDVCQRLGVKAMLDGTISRLGSSYVVTLGATDCRTGGTIGREQQEAAGKDQVLRALGLAAKSLRTTLGESLPSIQRFDVPIEQATTTSLDALRAYAMGIAERRKGRELESVAFFNQALELDREFAAAYTMLSTVYGSLGEWRQSEEYAKLAYDRHTRVSERERLFIEYQYHDRVTGDQDKAAQTLEVWKLSYPRDSRPANALALIHNRFGRYEQGVAEAREALRRSPGHPFPMSNLGVSLRGLGRYEESRKVAEEAVTLGVATTPTRRLLYQLGVLAGDGSEKAQLEWAKNRPREFDLISAQAQIAAFEGRLNDTIALYTQASDKALARGLRGTAASYAAHMAWTEALYRDQRTARERVRAIAAGLSAEGENPDTILRFRIPTAMALVGMTAEARASVAWASTRYPDSTVVRTVLVPSVSAAAALSQNRPADAVDALNAAMQAERGTVAALVPIYLRGEAFLAERDAASARREFQSILDARGADPFAPVIPLAHLGLGRAFALAGDLAKSRHAYDEFFRLWARADPDLRVLRAARAEYGRLSTTPAPAPRR